MTPEEFELLEQRKAILIKMKETEKQLQELTKELVECNLHLKKIRGEKGE